MQIVEKALDLPAPRPASRLRPPLQFALGPDEFIELIGVLAERAGRSRKQPPEIVQEPGRHSTEIPLRIAGAGRPPGRGALDGPFRGPSATSSRVKQRSGGQCRSMRATRKQYAAWYTSVPCASPVDASRLRYAAALCERAVAMSAQSSRTGKQSLEHGENL